MLLLANIEEYNHRVNAGFLRRKAEGMQFSASLRSEVERQSSYESIGTDAIITVSGPLSYKYDFWCWLYDGASYQTLQMALEAANGSNDVKRIVLVLDTPGGDVVGCRETARMIAASAKPVDAFVDPLCASAGLWLASQCRSITMVESGDIGSLGVQSMVVSYKKMFEKAGIDIELIRADISPDKNLGHPYEEISDKAKEEAQARVNVWGERFLADVAAGRKVDRDKALAAFGKGRMLGADEAIAAGLADRVGTLTSILAEGEKPKSTSKYNPHK